MTFRTEDGFSIPAVTAAQMREVDRIAIVGTGPNLFQMMENAGRNLAEFVVSHLGSAWKESAIVVLAGSGGNGGGGICAARHLANRGAHVSLCTTGESAMQDVIRWQYHLYKSADGREASVEGLRGLHPDLVVDAMIGYGLNGSPSTRVATVIEWANHSGSPIISLDIPSGLDATTGETNGASISATSTLTLALPKTGLASPLAGRLFLADIGIPPSVFRHAGIDYRSPFDHRYVIPIKRET